MIEQAGVATAVLSWMPELTVAVGAPRVVGIGYPGSAPFGLPGEAAEQRAILRAALEAAAGMRTPGERVDLPYTWAEDRPLPRPPEPPPIVGAIRKRPWLFLTLLRGKVPADETNVE